MNNFWVKFAYTLERYELLFRPAGPQFHCWLPDGERDAITLENPSEDFTLKMWFERYGFVDDAGFIRHHHNRREVDPSIVPRQAVLDAGALWGSIELRNVSEAAIAAVQGKVEGDSEYIALGKRIVKRILEPAVSRLLQILRVNYGQYWIREYVRWDSRKDSIGACCNDFQLRWSLDGGINWAVFRPDKAVSSAIVTLPGPETYKELLNADDWDQIRKLMGDGYEPALIGELVTRAHELLDQGHERYALLEANTAIELAVEDFLKKKVAQDRDFLTAIQAFWELSLKAKVITVSALAGVADESKIKLAVKAIDLRNRVVHEGLTMPPDSVKLIRALLRIAAAFLTDVSYKFPEMSTPNALGRPLHWPSVETDTPPARSVKPEV